MKSTDWIGHRQGSLTIESFEGLKHFGRGKAAYFTFRCDCGNSFVSQKSNVIGKGRNDCGCSKGPAKWTAPAGATRNPLYKVWAHMIDRCTNPNNGDHKNYGGRGISVCRRWTFGEGNMTGFDAFLADMGPRPDGFTIERVQVNGNYEPGNCMWLPKRDQSKNQRRVRLVRIGDRVKTIPDWCAETGINYFVAIKRVRNGWPPDKAVTHPHRRVA